MNSDCISPRAQVLSLPPLQTAVFRRVPLRIASPLAATHIHVAGSLREPPASKTDASCSFHYEHTQVGSVRSATKHPLKCFLKIRGTGVRDIQELLRIPINQREPRTLDLHHNAMA